MLRLLSTAFDFTTFLNLDVEIYNSSPLPSGVAVDLTFASNAFL